MDSRELFASEEFKKLPLLTRIKIRIQIAIVETLSQL